MKTFGHLDVSDVYPALQETEISFVSFETRHINKYARKNPESVTLHCQQKTNVQNHVILIPKK